MPYCTKTQVAAEAKVGVEFSTSTLPTSTKVDEIIAEVDAEIDAWIGKKYTVPVSSAAALLIVRSISIALVVERVRGIIDSSAPMNDSENPASKDAAHMAKYARGKLMQIADGTMPLTGETLLSSYDGVRSYAVSNGEEPVLKKGCDQW